MSFRLEQKSLTLNGVIIMVKLWPRYGDFSIFQDGGHCHLGFSNFVKFDNRKAQEGQTASPYQISSKSVICKTGNIALNLS